MHILTLRDDVVPRAMAAVNALNGSTISYDTGNHVDGHRRARDKRWDQRCTFRIDRHDDSAEHPELFMLLGRPSYVSGIQRRTHKLCWHGHYELFAAIFRIDPNAEIRTCKRVYVGVEDFNSEAMRTGSTNVGSIISPMEYRDSCYCGLTAEEIAEERAA